MTDRGKTSPKSTAGSFAASAGQRSRIDPITDEAIEVWAGVGMLPGGQQPDWADDPWAPAPVWVGGRYDAWGRTPTGDLVVVKNAPDEVYTAVTTESGVINAELRFPAPDGRMDVYTLAAHRAVLNTWLEGPDT